MFAVGVNTHFFLTFASCSSCPCRSVDVYVHPGAFGTAFLLIFFYLHSRSVNRCGTAQEKEKQGSIERTAVFQLSNCAFSISRIEAAPVTAPEIAAVWTVASESFNFFQFLNS